MEQYSEVCRPRFDDMGLRLISIDERTGKIEQKVFNGFETKITNTDRRVQEICAKVDSLQNRLIGLIITAAGGCIGIIVTLWITLGG